MTKRKPKSAEVVIDRFSKKGHGVGGTNDPTPYLAEVPFTIPGDHVRALLLRKRNHIYVSRLEEMMTPSSSRIEPRCVHFGICGGCRWQQLSYQDQLKIKQSEIETMFRSLLDSESIFHPIAACDPPWHYRNKMEFTFSSDAAGNQYLGLIMDSSRGKVLNLTECHLVNPWFIDALKAAREWWKESGLTAYHHHTDTGSLRTLTIREGKRSGDRLVMLTVSGNPQYALHQRHLDSFRAFMIDAIEPLSDSKLSIFLRIHQALKGSETTFYEMLLHGPDHIRETLHVQTEKGETPIGLNFTISPTAFFQPNTQQAEKLYGMALQLLKIPEESVVYDLYCGTGTLGICAAKKAKKVIGVEISPESSLDARTNVAANKLDNITIITGSVADVIKQILQEKTLPLPDVVMVDPPRSGLDPATINYLINLRPEKILYISCNPATQADNIKELKSHGYRILAVQPVDQFPHTVHIENIVILSL